jgi:DNA helicase-2/ATP-dependent DNA helicase PcrA
MKLNDKQLEIINSGSDAYCILAVPGSGKTTLLVHKVANYISQGIKPEEIMIVTFTNNAAKEIKERISKLLDVDITGLWIGTFHSIALRLLSKHSDAVNLSKNFTIIDQSDQTKVVKELLVKHDASASLKYV